MKLPMPTGSPIFTTQTDLDSLFGFIKATVIAPTETEKELRIPVLPVKH